MKRLIPAVVTLTLFLCAAALAQQSAPTLATYPDILTPQAASAVSLQSYKSVLEGNVATIFQLEQNDVASISVTNANVAALQGQLAGMQALLNAQAATIATMQAQLATLAQPPPSVTKITWAGIADGAINGAQGPINYGTGFWCVKSGELAACADNMPQRSFTFSQPVTILSFTFSTTTAVTTGIKLTSQSGQIVTCSTAAINQDSTCTPAWATPVTSFTVTSTNGDFPDMRLRSVSFQ